jgi:hypothetical protein
MDESQVNDANKMLDEGLKPDEKIEGFDVYGELIEAESQLGLVRRTALTVLRNLIKEKGSISSELDGLLLAEDAARERWKFALERLQSYEDSRHLPWAAAYGVDAFPSARNSDD